MRNLLYLISIWYPQTKFQRNRSRFLFRELRFSDVMSGGFGSKNGQLSKTSAMYDFQVKCNPQTPTDAILNGFVCLLES